LLCDVELRWTMTSLLAQNDQAGGQVGTGDNWFGAQIRLYRQTARVPTIAVSYAAKAPTASREKGLGSGQMDHSLTFLASKDILGIHYDYNTTAFFIGRPGGSGFDRNFQFNLSLSRPIKGPLGFTGEFYGNTELNAANPGFASALWALTYNVSPRLVLDGGIDTGLTHGATQKRFFVGMTYSIANLYPGFKRHQAGGNAAKDVE
ncbi:MAG: transporter, partial [Candidatus Acidiferrales bacterium]